jgi:hypothetical protein
MILANYSVSLPKVWTASLPLYKIFVTFHV